MAKEVVCVDCRAEGVATWRPTPHGGPRTPLCVTHNRARKKSNKARAHELRTEKTYGITGPEYKEIKEFQGGKCAICQKATGATKNLAVDHQHNKPGCDHAPNVGCRACVRGLLCGPCNQTIGIWDIDALVRAIVYLRNPPAQVVLNSDTLTDTTDFKGIDCDQFATDL
jgi:Recombination endonuclease VII